MCAAGSSSSIGGCAGNMAYTYKMLGGQALIMAAVGEDFGSYMIRSEKKKLSIEITKKQSFTIPGWDTSI